MSEIKITTQQAEAVSLRNEGEMIKGPQGDSAYQVALNNGFKGTEEAWLATLVGAQGPQGPVGPQGTPGVKGVDGKDGRQGVDGKPGKDGAPGPQGPQGEVGPRGPAGEPGKDGENGKDGYTPIKGKDYFDGVDGKDYVLTEADKQEIAANLNEENNNRITENEKDIVDIETYLDTITPKASAKGELVHITDALPLPTFKTTADGNVEQETTKGYNLIGLPDVEETTIKGLTFSIKNGLLKLNGTATVLVPLGNVLFNNLKETNKYRLQIFPQSGTWDNGWIGTRGYIDGTQKWYQQIAKTDNTNYVVKTLTVEELENNNRCDMYVANGSSFNNFSCYVLFKKGEEYANYEPYTGAQASPNSSYPQEIEVIEGYNLAKLTKGKVPSVSNGQLVDYPSGGYSDFIKVDTNERYVFTYEGDLAQRYLFAYDDKYNYLGNLSDAQSKDTSLLFSEHPTTKYIRIRIDVAGSGHELPQVQFARGLGVSTIIPYGCVGYKIIGENILLPKNQMKAKYFIPKGTTVTAVAETLLTHGNIKFYDIDDNVVWFGISGDVKYRTKYLDKDIYYVEKASTDNMALYIGNVPEKPYEPYQEQIVPLDLKGNFVGAINDTIKDYLVTDKKKYWLVKNVGKVVLDGSESWDVTTENDIKRYFVRNLGAKPLTMVMSNYFIGSTNGTKFFQYGYVENPGSGNISFSLGNNDTLATFLTWLSTNNLTVYYQLAEPQIIELGELPEPIKTFEGVNNIQLLANLDTEIEVKYALDVKKYFENKLASIQEQIL